MSVPERDAQQNPYVSMLVTCLRSYGVEVSYFSWKRLLLERYDVVHVHWPEGLVRGSSIPRSFAKVLLVGLALLLLRARGTVLIRTVHNLVPHEKSRLIERFGIHALQLATDGFIHLSKTTMVSFACDRESELIPHPSYRSWGPFTRPKSLGKDSIRIPRVLYFGAIRPYKGVVNFIASMPLDERRFVLRVVGRPFGDGVEDEVRSLLADRPWISYRLEFLDDVSLWDELQRADMAVLPFEQVTNSGSAMLAASANLPILMTDSPLGRELQDCFGSQWIRLFSPPDECGSTILGGRSVC